MSTHLHVEAGVRYWEDADVNGVSDVDGSKIPFRAGKIWKPIIDLRSGSIVGWPAGTTASVHYKVCDDGEYWLADDSGKRTHRWDGYYVPDRFLCHGDRGYGDYIILDIDEHGIISNWVPPEINGKDWERIVE